MIDLAPLLYCVAEFQIQLTATQAWKENVVSLFSVMSLIFVMIFQP